MGKKIYVGNLAYGVTDGTLEQMFAAHGSVQSAQVIMDRETGRSKGFGFVEMGSDQEAQAAIAALNGKEVGGPPSPSTRPGPRKAAVAEAAPGAVEAATGAGAVVAVAMAAAVVVTKRRSGCIPRSFSDGRGCCAFAAGEGRKSQPQSQTAYPVAPHRPRA